MDKGISKFDPNEEDKQNPYHGVLTLTIQGKGIENHSATIPRGPGRPPIVEVSIDDPADADDPVSLHPNSLISFLNIDI